MSDAIEPDEAEDHDERVRGMVRDHADLIWRTLRRLGLPEHTSQDAAQRVFMVATRRLGEIEPGAERAFLIQTAVRVASSERRSFARRREEKDDSAIVHAVDTAPSPDDLLDQSRARALLEAVLVDLPMDLRTVFVLFELEELTVPTIAELLDLPRGTVSSRLRRARESFHAAVRRHQAHLLRTGKMR